jgi:hypothetical protein
MGATDAVCRYCRWEGPDPVMDAHGSIFCPRCARPVDYKIVVEELKRQGLWREGSPQVWALPPRLFHFGFDERFAAAGLGRPGSWRETDT